MFGVTPDIVCLAKALGGGVPCGAIGGTARGDVGDRRRPLRPGRHVQRQPADDGGGAGDAHRGAHRPTPTRRLDAPVADDVDGAMQALHRPACPATGTAFGAKGCLVFNRDAGASTTASSSRWTASLSHLPLARPAQRRRVPAAVGQERAVDDLGPAHRRRRRPVRATTSSGSWKRRRHSRSVSHIKPTTPTPERLSRWHRCVTKV